ncbi:glycosyl hydrolase [Bacillus sp. HMF5848]|uniref:glycoside hydrolase family 3 C-terminal domain-containing protein n=1 Tax=Bacillus sp. HMF5848 TaxID=2495421 RepID=UPI000F799AC1|nr:glycoside hydrolase family 3 C-terminal domain-containing protein [Bacillus sp. HMF5848]RSK29261.1 glycosyl hydrolase [Bacillus sp. HMF5848]
MVKDVTALISQMTLEEKASLCSGLDFWHLKGIERLGIPSVMVTDGPHGLRKQANDADHLGIYDSVPATCFPSAVGLASTWNRELVERVGKALGNEAQAEKVAALLGPGVNIKRSPLCGRNFEYFSEDPYLSSEMAIAHINGVQSQGVGTSLKHFAVNNQEYRRMTVDAVVDERTLREIYLASFENTVKKAQPWTVMCSYNKVNGEFASQHKRLLTDILRDEWGFDGLVVSDWGAVDERVKGLQAGLDLEMPSSYGNGDNKIVEAVKNGSLSEDVLNHAVERIVTFILKYINNANIDATYDKEEHHTLAREVAAESVVLLKNENQILPLLRKGTISIIGALAKTPRYQGGGSSHVNPTKIDDIIGEIRKSASNNVNVLFALGYELDSDAINEDLVKQARDVAEQSDAVVLFVGLPDRYESEGYDREHLRIPENQKNLIEQLAEMHDNLVVVLNNGAPIEMPWLKQVKAVLEGYLGGQAFGGAIAKILFGDVNPSGKLAESFPVKLSDNPSHLNFPGDRDTVEYREGIFVGYRYYDTKEIDPLFPFGYGLSYTNFEYSDLRISSDTITDVEAVYVSLKVKNVGNIRGKDVVQLYVRDVESNVTRPLKELVGFDKVSLEPGEEKTVTFHLDKRAFAYYSVELNDWHVETGEFRVLIGQSSRDIKLEGSIFVESTVPIVNKIHRNTTVGDIMANPILAPVAMQFLKSMMEDSPLSATQKEGNANEMFDAMLKHMPLRAIVNFSMGAFTEKMLENIIDTLNSMLDTE